jgi:hypothetical protein
VVGAVAAALDPDDRRWVMAEEHAAWPVLIEPGYGRSCPLGLDPHCPQQEVDEQIQEQQQADRGQGGTCEGSNTGHPGDPLIPKPLCKTQLQGEIKFYFVTISVAALRLSRDVRFVPGSDGATCWARTSRDLPQGRTAAPALHC